LLHQRQQRTRKILLIYDGLDKYEDDISIMFEKLERKHNEKLQNMKPIITTRLQAGFPETLKIKNILGCFHLTQIK
jgi:hypothetical protein